MKGIIKIGYVFTTVLFLIGASFIPIISGQDKTNFYANSDIEVQNGGISGSYVNTQSPDDSYEGISERESGGKPSNRYSYLEHKWTISLSGSFNTLHFNIEAYHTANSEADDFIFAYSTNDATYIDMVIVTKTSDDDSFQSYELPNTLTGTIYIRVLDSDRSQGNRNIDTVYIDHMYIVGDSGPDVIPPVISNADSNVDDNIWTKMDYNTIGGDLGRREFHVMAYDSDSHKTILFGGQDGDAYNDTWAYDYTTNTWENRSPTIIGGNLVYRSVSGFPGFAYDSDSDRCILFGGYNNTQFFDETWAYDYNTNTWTNMNPNDIGGTLLGRQAHRIAYYETADRMILFGGAEEEGIGNRFMNDTWEYDYNNNTWKKLNPTVIGGVLPEMCGFGMTYDASADRIVLFGGYNGSDLGTFYDQTWIFDYHNNTWTKQNPNFVGGALTPRFMIQMVYDSNKERSILFGGKQDSNTNQENYNFNETWEYDYDDKTWYNLSYLEIGGTLYPREAYGVVYDSASDKTIVTCGFYQHGYNTPENDCFLNDTWVLNSNELTSVITWATDEPADSVVNYGLTTALGSTESDSTLVTSHQIALSDLLPDTTYYFEVQSTDGASNTATDDNNGNYYTFFTGQDTTPPVISNVQSSGITHNSATVIWDTDESSNSRVNYGINISLGQTEFNAAMGTSHSIDLLGLLPETKYYYEVESTDEFGNTATDNNNGSYYNFTTDSEPSNAMHIYSIDMWYETDKNKYIVFTQVKIVDTGDNPVEGADVYLELVDPVLNVEYFNGLTGTVGTVTFVHGPTPKSGTYTSTVTDVVKSGWIYNSGDNVETSEQLTISK
jgi:hypothetical protein